VVENEKKRRISILDVVTQKEKYKPAPPRPKVQNLVYHGITLVPNVVERTPPFVEEVVAGSPASAAKLQPDDLIVYVDGLPVPDINTFNAVLETYAPEQKVNLVIQRGEKLITVPLKLDKPRVKKKAA
jgi:serine protease Do